MNGAPFCRNIVSRGGDGYVGHPPPTTEMQALASRAPMLRPYPTTQGLPMAITLRAIRHWLGRVIPWTIWLRAMQLLIRWLLLELKSALPPPSRMAQTQL